MSLVELGSAFWVAFGASAVLAYPIYRWLLARKSRQTISEYAPEGHQVKQGTPTMGGLIIVIGYLVSLGFQSFAGDGTSSSNRLGWYGPWALLVLGFALIGFVDDFVVPRMIKGKRGLGWKQKIVMQFLVATLAAYLIGHRIDLNFGIAVFLILFFSNAYNFADGLDGLAGSILISLAAGLAVLAAVSINGFAISSVLVPLIGALIPFLILNAPPAKVFMGDVGSLPIGAVLGLSVACQATAIGFSGGALAEWSSPLGMVPPSALWVPLTVISLLMVVELVPVPLQILSVKLRKKRLFPYTPIHHAFEKAGWPESRVVWMFAITQFLLSCLAVYLCFSLTAEAAPERYHYYYFSPQSGSSR